MSDNLKEPQITEEEKQAILLQRQEKEKMVEFMNKIKSVMDEYEMDLVIDQNSPIGNPSLMPMPRKPTKAHL